MAWGSMCHPGGTNVWSVAPGPWAGGRLQSSLLTRTCGGAVPEEAGVPGTKRNTFWDYGESPAPGTCGILLQQL